MRTLYRGCRLRDVNFVKENGMKYYWDGPKAAVSDVIHTIERLHKLSKFKTNYWVREYIIEASGEGRIQLWATEDRLMAESYARDTPELMMLVLRNLGIYREQRRRILDKEYGKPYVVSFTDDKDKTTYNDINVACGKFIPPERILSVEPVDVTQPDQYMVRLRAKLMIPKEVVIVGQSIQSSNPRS